MTDGNTKSFTMYGSYKQKRVLVVEVINAVVYESSRKHYNNIATVMTISKYIYLYIVSEMIRHCGYLFENMIYLNKKS